VIVLHPFPLRLWGQPPRAGIYDEGCFGCIGIERISRIASEHPNVVTQRSGIFVQRPRDGLASRGRSPKNHERPYAAIGSISAHGANPRPSAQSVSIRV